MENSISIGGRKYEISKGPTLDEVDQAAQRDNQKINFKLVGDLKAVDVFVRAVKVIPVKPDYNPTRDRPEGRTILGHIFTGSGTPEAQNVMFNYYPEYPEAYAN